MSTSDWFYPSTITQLPSEAENLIAWKSPVSDFKCPLSTVKPLLHIPGTGGPGPGLTNVRYRTTALRFTNFQIPLITDVISGIELKFEVDRVGRIADAEVFLVYNEEIISVNKTNFEQDSGEHLINFNKNLYGGATDLWDATVTPEMINDPSFGVHIRMQSHPYFPHNATPIIRQVSIRYYSA